MKERLNDMKKTFGCANRKQAYELKDFLTCFGYTVDVEFRRMRYDQKSEAALRI